MSVTITALEAENVKRIKAVTLTHAPTGLTLVGGNNNQGKTSVLAALGVERTQEEETPRRRVHREPKNTVKKNSGGRKAG